jgi:glutathione S-transferase
MGMHKLYWNHGSASITAQMALEETGAPYELAFVDFEKGDHRSPDYLKLNPNGKVPVLLIDGERPMFETCAIATYLGDRYPASGLTPAIDDPARSSYLQWIFHLTNSVQPLYLAFYYPERFTTDPADEPRIKARMVEQIGEAWARIDRALAENGPYMIGERFSAADLPAVMLSGWRQAQPQILERNPHLSRLVDLVSARPAVSRVLQQNQAAA